MADPVKPISERIREKLPWRKTKQINKSSQTLEIPARQEPDTSPQPPKNANSEDDQDMWRLAYNELQKEDPELIEAYSLSLEFIDPTSSNPLSSPESIQDIVSALTRAREAKQWTVAFGARQIKVRAQVEKLVKFAHGCNSIIGPAAKSQPYAALAWSGVTVCLSLLSDGLEQVDVMLAGFNYTCDKQRYWWLGETDLWEHHVPQKIREPLIKLYAHILKYQATTICHLSKRQVQRALKVKETWDEMRLKIERQDEVCRDLLTMIDRINTQKKAEAEWKAIEESPAVQRGIRDSLDLMRSENQLWRDQEDKKRLLENLSSDCDYERGKNLIPPTVAGTCEWFFTHDKFQKWRDMDSACILWLSAGPGCGKSVLSRALIDDGRLATKESTSTVCYFFFKEGDPQRLTSTSALSAMLHQLFTLHPDKNLINCALDSHNDFGKNLCNNFHRLWNILLKCAEHDEAGDIVCLIDALDECKEDDCKELVDCIVRFYDKDSQEKPLPRLKLLVTGRPYDHIAKLQKLSSERYFCFDNNNPSRALRDDIDLVIQARAEKLTHFDDLERQKIVRLFKEKENCTYLWFTLMFNIIESTPSAYCRLSDVVELLAEIPPEVDDAYEHMLEKAQNRRVAMKLFQIILASRPMHIEVLNTALTLATKREKIKTYEDIDKNLYKSESYHGVLRNLSGLFLVIQEDYVHFIHRTAREFLLIDDSAYCRSNRRWKGSLNEEDAHSLMWNVCLLFLQLCPDHNLVESGAKCFVTYAIGQWHKHYRNQSAQGAELSKSDARIWCLKTWKVASEALNSLGLRLLQPLEGNSSCDRRRQEICAVVTFGLLPVFLHILQYGKLSLDELNYALQLACYYVRPQWVQTLIDSGASPVPESHMRCYSPLVLCSRSYRIRSRTEILKVINILLANGVSLDWQNTHGETELHMAAFAGDWIVIECLTHFGANTELVNSEGDTPLHLATKCNDWLRVYHVMDQLCLSGARTEAEDSSGLTALGLILNRVEGETQALLMPRSSRAENCIYILLVERRANASHPSVKRPLEILMARKDLPNIFGILAEFHSEYKAREGIVL